MKVYILHENESTVASVGCATKKSHKLSPGRGRFHSGGQTEHLGQTKDPRWPKDMAIMKNDLQEQFNN